MTLSKKLENAFVRVATEFKYLRKNFENSMNFMMEEIIGGMGLPGDLNTTDKSNLVAAINELKTEIGNLPVGTEAGAEIDDAQAASNKVYSSTKVEELVTKAIADLVGGADTNSDTLKEIADKITALMQADEGLLSFKASQTLSPEEQAQAATNLGLGDTTVDFVAVFQTEMLAGFDVGTPAA